MKTFILGLLVGGWGGALILLLLPSFPGITFIPPPTSIQDSSVGDLAYIIHHKVQVCEVLIFDSSFSFDK